MAAGTMERRTVATRMMSEAPGRDITPSSPSSDDVGTDEADKKLEALGYTPVFKREFSTWSSFSFAMSISGVYGSLMSTWIYGLQAGGAAAIMWSWIIGGAGALALAMSLAELASAYPNSGAMYFSLKFLAPEDQVPFLCWMSGYINLCGTIAGSAGTEYAASQMLLAAVSIASDFSYTPSTSHVVAVTALLTVVHASINTLPTRWLTRLTSGYVVFHMSALVGACVCLLVLTKDKHTLGYAFTDFQPSSGWSPPGFAFLFGCLSPAWIMTGADSTARIAEEAHNPSVVVPQAIARASTFTYLTGLLFNLVLVLCMPADVGTLLSTPLGQPVAQLMLTATGGGGRAPAVVFTLAGFAVLNLVAVPGLQAGSRGVFALARDDALPLSRVWRRLAPRTRTPVAAVWLYAALEVAVALLGLASAAAAGAVFAVCTVALNASYLLPIGCKLVYHYGGGRGGPRRRFERGPWHLGRWGWLVDGVALGWNGFVSVLFLLPTTLPVTGENMNYAAVVLVFVVLFAAGFWYAHGRHYYTGPGTRSSAGLESAPVVVV